MQSSSIKGCSTIILVGVVCYIQNENENEFQIVMLLRVRFRFQFHLYFHIIMEELSPLHHQCGFTLLDLRFLSEKRKNGTVACCVYATLQ